MSALDNDNRLIAEGLGRAPEKEAILISPPMVVGHSLGRLGSQPHPHRDRPKTCMGRRIHDLLSPAQPVMPGPRAPRADYGAEDGSSHTGYVGFASAVLSS
jgi:hypothetical protein